jgi:hypothetical protein
VAGKQTGEGYQIISGPVIHAQLPYATFPVSVMSNDASPVSQKRGIGQFREVPQRRRQRVTGFRIPHPRRFINACRNKPSAIRTKGCRSHLLVVFNWGNEPSSRIHIPDDCREILARGDNAVAVGAKGSVQNSVTMHQLGTDWSAVFGAPDLCIAFRKQWIPAAADDLGIVSAEFGGVNRL